MNIEVKKNRKYGLEEWLINFAITVIKLVDKLPNTMAPNYHSWQLTRSSISPAQIYGEALGAETNNDFIHKLKIVLKEQRESYVQLKISERLTSSKDLKYALDCRQL